MSGCHMEPLVLAERDGRLEGKERASVKRHLRTCASCRAVTGDLAELAELGRQLGDTPRLSPLEHRRRRLAVLKAATAPRASRRRAEPRRRLVVAAIVATGVAALLLGSWSSTQHRQTPPPRASVVTAARASIAAVVLEAPRARFDRQAIRAGGGELQRVRLYEGTVDVQVQELTGSQRFIVATSDAEVEVRGTRFSVRASDDQLREVVVQEGVVEVRRGSATLTLRAGDAWSAPDRVVMADPDEPRQHVASPVLPSNGVATGPAPEPAPVPGKEAQPAEEPQRRRSGASKDFATAMKLLEGGDYAAATSALRDFSKKHEDSALTEDADFLTIIALQRAGRHAAAAQAARRYLAAHPNGARRAQARAIAARKR